MNNDIKLKPCPFCGQIPEILGEETDEPIGVHCLHCDYELGYFDTVEEAAETWNTRKGETFADKEVEFIEKAISMAIRDCEINPPKPLDENLKLMWSIKFKCDELLKFKKD